MSIDEDLAERVRRRLAGRQGLSERRMFGCLAFFLHGNLACGVHEDELIVRVNPDEVESLLKQRHTRRFDLSGRPMKGWLLVRVAQPAALSRWVDRGIAYAATLPRKSDRPAGAGAAPAAGRSRRRS